MRRFLALMLCAVLCLSCCAAAGTAEGWEIPAYSEMTYTRPDVDAFRELAEALCGLAAGSDSSAILVKLYELEDLYWDYDTETTLAGLHYFADLNDSRWQEEYEFCSENYTTINTLLNEVYSAMAASPCRRQLESRYFGKDFLDAYEDSEEDSVLNGLYAQETELINRYYTLCADDSSLLSLIFSDDSEKTRLLLELIRTRKQYAARLGYDSYEDYAAEQVYGRDYTSADTDALLEAVRRELVPLYRVFCAEDPVYSDCRADAANAWLASAAEAMGGTVAEAYRFLTEYGLSDIGQGSSRMDTSYETYLINYEAPFIFVTLYGDSEDCLSVSHEFGHFCNDYASWGSTFSIDIAEFFSQTMELLSLVYADEPADFSKEELRSTALENCLCIYVEQACYTDFERRLYALEDTALTEDAVTRIWRECTADYGLDTWTDDDYYFTCVEHFYEYSLYCLSYVVSCHAAVQVYRAELAEPGEGLRIYESNLAPESDTFLAFLDELGLESPFEPDSLTGTAEFFRSALAGTEAA